MKSWQCDVVEEDEVRRRVANTHFRSDHRLAVHEEAEARANDVDARGRTALPAGRVVNAIAAGRFGVSRRPRMAIKRQGDKSPGRGELSAYREVAEDGVRRRRRPEV